MEGGVKTKCPFSPAKARAPADLVASTPAVHQELAPDGCSEDIAAKEELLPGIDILLQFFIFFI